MHIIEIYLNIKDTGVCIQIYFFYILIIQKQDIYQHLIHLFRFFFWFRFVLQHQRFCTNFFYTHNVYRVNFALNLSCFFFWPSTLVEGFAQSWIRPERSQNYIFFLIIKYFMHEKGNMIENRARKLIKSQIVAVITRRDTGYFISKIFGF